MDNDSGDGAVLQTALDWLMRKHEGALSDADRAALQAWLAASSQHRQVFHEAEQLWMLTGLIPSGDERSE